MSTDVFFVDGGYISQEYLANPYSPVQPYGHTGRDTAVAIGTTCRAIADGRVIYCGAGNLMPLVYCNEFMTIAGSTDSGNVMFIEHEGWVANYNHLSGYPAGIDDGVYVKRGQAVALSGNTGRSTGPHVHMEVMIPPCVNTPMWSRYNPTLQEQHENRIARETITSQPEPLNSRRNGPAVANMRSTASLSGELVGEIPANRLDVFIGYVLGESVSLGGVTSNIWYVDKGEDGRSKERYVWAGLFTEQKISGLPNLTPAPVGTNLKPNQRLVGPAGAQVREKPESGSRWLRGVAPNEIEAFTHYVYGQNVTVGGITTNIWYKDSLGYTWAGVFTEQKIDGLIEYKLTQPEPSPSVPVPEAPKYSFTKALNCVTEVVPAADGNYEVGNFPAKPTAIVIHQFIAGALRFDVHISSVLNEFAKKNVQKSSHLAIEGKKITQPIRFGPTGTDRAYHAGPSGNDFIGFETYGGQDEETLKSVAKAIYETEVLYGYKMELKTHNTIMPTQCGDQVDLLRLRQMADALHGTVTEPIDPKPPVADDKVNEAAVLDKFFAWLKDSFLNRK